MPRSNALIPANEVLETLTLADLCRVSGLSADWILELVEEGILEPTGADGPAWRFDSSSITVIRKVQRLQTDLRINLPGIATILSLAEENARLKRRLQHVESDLPIVIPLGEG